MSEQSSRIGIAVIGMAGRFPGAHDIESFWRMVCEGRSGVRDFDDEELREHGAVEADLRHPNFVRAGAPMDQPDMFDAKFFGINPRDAELMDPQHRVMLEIAYASLEDAGYGDPKCRPLTGVFVGSGMPHYAFQVLSHHTMRGPMGSLQAALGNGESHLATRISYKLDLRGPSMFVQTACSTSLTAVHLACRSLLSYECDMAIAGGSSLSMPFPSGYVHLEGGMLSSDGRCRSFDADASGTVIGNGAAAVILKRLEDAQRDGDTIQAVILASAVNNDGSNKVGYTAPSVEGQTRVIAEAISLAGIAPDTVGLIEAHGTATRIGDPIEVASLAQVYRGAPGSCWIGSVKSNVGHMLAAAGVAGLIKAVLSVSRRTIPPIALFERANPGIDFAATPFQAADRLADWTLDQAATAVTGKRRAAVSSFGIGGTNAHVIIEQAPDLPVRDAATQWQVLPLSAASPDSYRSNAIALAHALHTTKADLGDIAATLQRGRQAHALRGSVVARTHAEAAAAFEKIAEIAEPGQARPGKTAFLFPGQGMQRAGMFRGLHDGAEVFRERFQLCARVLRAETGEDLEKLVFAPNATDEGLTPTRNAQPALFAVEYALACQWMAWGLVPGVLLGHSIGEFAAACIAGVFSPEDAMRVVIARGRLMQHQASGAMIAVSVPEAEARSLAGMALSLSAINAPRRCVLAGDEAAVRGLEQTLAARGIACQRLKVSHAFHSPAMEPASAALEEILGGIGLSPPRIPLLSSATGGWLTDAQATDPAYWGRQLVLPVLFQQALEALAMDAPAALLEVGPGAALTGFGRAVLPAAVPGLVSDPGTRGVDDLFHYFDLLGRLWAAGAPLDWTMLQGGGQPRRVPLPTYSFDRQRYWIAAKADAALPVEPEAVRPVETARRADDVADWFYVPSWRRSIAPNARPAPDSVWLLFLPHGVDLAERLATHLLAMGYKLAIARPGSGFKRIGDAAWEMAPDAPEQYDTLLQQLAESGLTPRIAAHLWGIGPVQARADIRAQCFDSLLCLAQAVGRAEAMPALGLAIVAEGAQRAGGETFQLPERALAIGPAKVIGQELSNLTARHIDLVAADWHDPSALDRLVAELAHFGADTSGRARDQHGIVALRGRDRLVQTFERVRLPDAAPPLVQGGVYLVTGGLGGIGLVLAERIATTCAMTLVLTTRTAPGHAVSAKPSLPWPAHDGLTPAQRGAIARIEAAGSLVRIAELDIADADALSHLVAALAAEFGRLHGVIHAAGAAGGGLIQLKRLDVAHAVLRPKLAGVWALERALEGVDVDFLVHCSSLSSVRGGFGQVDYAAANAFLDAHAQAARNPRIGQVISINWGAWAEVGMAVAAVKRQGFLPCPFWLRGDDAQGARLSHPLLDRVVESPGSERAVRVRLRPPHDWVMADHRLNGVPTMPGTAYLEILRAAWEAVYGPGPVELANVEFRAPAAAAEPDLFELYVMLEQAGDACQMRIVTRTGAGDGAPEVLVEHVRAILRAIDQAAAPPHIDIGSARAASSEIRSVQAVETVGALQFGSHWQLPAKLFIGAAQGIAQIDLPAAFAAELRDFHLHPALLDVALGLARQAALPTPQAMLPFGYKSIRIFGPMQKHLACQARAAQSQSQGMVTVDAVIVAPDGAVLIEITGYQLRPLVPSDNAAASGDRLRSRAAGVLAGAILSHEGADAFMRALASGQPQLVVSPLDLDSVVAKWQGDENSVVQRVATASLPRPARRGDAAVGARPLGSVEEQIAGIWTALLGHEELARDDDFFALGGDSLLGIQLHAKVQDMFGVALTLAAVFENPTIANLATIVTALLTGKSGGSAAPSPIVARGEATIAELLSDLA